MKDDIIYFDNAATSWPKPRETGNAMTDYLNNQGGSPGRSGHRLSIEAGRIVLNTRENLARLFSIEDPFQMVFTHNATEALNLVIRGLLAPGDHVIVSPMEHNAVMRPLRWLEEKGLEITRIQSSPEGDFDPEAVSRAVKKNTRIAFFAHAGNVTGTIQPIKKTASLLKEKNILICVDAAQTAGTLPIDVEKMGIDFLAVTGHKSLMGPPGTGALYIRPGLETSITPLMRGGTGSRSEAEEQPVFMPDRYESGTPNTIGLAGLGAGVETILTKGIDAIRGHEMNLTKRFIDGIQSIPGVTLYGTENMERRLAVAAFNITGIEPSEASLFLDEEYNIMSRPGLHCAPSAHRMIGTLPRGTCRFSFGQYNTENEIDTALEAIEILSRRNK